MRHEVGIGDQDAWRIRVRAEHSDRLAGLHEQRLIALQLTQRCDDLIERVPIPRRAADAPVDHKFARPLRHLGVEVVHQHP